METRREHRIQTTATDSELALIERGAELAGLPVAAYLRACAIAVVRSYPQVLAERETPETAALFPR